MSLDITHAGGLTVFTVRKAIYLQAIRRVCRYHLGVEEPSMTYNVYIATRETHIPLLIRVWWNNATNRGSQKGVWESDAVIVPMISGNAEVGKDGTQ